MSHGKSNKGTEKNYTVIVEELYYISNPNDEPNLRLCVKGWGCEAVL